MSKNACENANIESEDTISQKLPRTMSISPSRLFAREMTQTTLSQAHTMCVFTWNLAGKMFTKDFDISQVINACTSEAPPDLLIFGFQELVPLNLFSFILDGEEPEQMIEFLSDELSYQFPELNYKCFSSESMMGLAIFCFCKSEILDNITEVKSTQVKTGFKGYVGNKGCVATRFLLNNVSVIVGCCHLECGEKYVEDRVKNLIDIVNSLYNDFGKEYSFFSHDVKVLFGDMNFRVDLPYETVSDMFDFFDDNK